MGRALTITSGLIAVLMAACSSRTGNETHGNFRIETWQTEAFGHTGHSFKIFHNHGRSSHVVADKVQYFLDPQNPDRLLFNGCSGDDEDGCALRYFDGVSDTEHLVTRDRYLRPGSTLVWSPDGRFLALPAQYRLLTLDLASGAVFDVATVLELREPGREINWSDLEWAPDGSVVSVKVWNSLTPPPSDIEADLFAIDPEASRVRYVASLPPNRRGDVWHEWESAAGGYRLRVLPEPSTYRKRPDQLPPQVEY